MAMLVVVPGKETLAEGAGILDGAEPVGEFGAILERSEMTFRERIVVGDMGTRVGLGDTEVGQEQGDRLGSHRRAPVGMDGELPLRDLELAASLRDEALGQ